MISQFMRRTTRLALLMAVVSGSLIVSAQTPPFAKPGNAAGNTTSRRSPSTSVADEKNVSEPIPKTSSSDSITLMEKELASAAVPAGPSLEPVAKPADSRTPTIGSKIQNGMQERQDASGSDWEFAVAPYLFMPAISGTVGARGRTLAIDASFGNVLDKLDLAVMGTLEARKGKFVFVSDLIWTKMSAERETPGGLYSTAKFGINLFVFDPEVGYRIADSKVGSFDVLGGVRVWSVESNLNLSTGLLPGFDVSQRKTWAAPVGGFRGLLNVSPKFFVSTKFDIGGAGVGADMTTQFYGGAGYRITPKIGLIGGYRYLQVDYDDGEDFLFDTKMNGFVFGAKFGF